jgi:nanoRNase/pAp phosphatase (c-di-AMP/oligoRNAs hydrolase)
VVELSPTVGFVDTVVGNTNLIVHQLLDSGATRFPVLLTVFKKGNNQVIVSLRSKNGEALPIALRLQGGGHANASGAVLPRSVRNVNDAIDYLRRVLNPQSFPAPSQSSNALNSMEGALAAAFERKG